MDAIQSALSKPERNSETMKAFGHRLYNQFTYNKNHRRFKELQWLEDLRAYKGIYDPDVKIEANASKVYPKITRSKVNIVLSRLHEMLFPEIDKNWEIKPTPDPRIAKETVKQIAIGLIQKDPVTGAVKLPTADELQLAIKKYADSACEKMSIQIDDQLTEMDYPEETKKVLRSGLMFGTGIMKGPMIGKRTKRIWEPTTDGDYEESQSDTEVPDLQFTRIWDWYPDMSVTDLEHIEGSFERHVMKKHDLRQLMKRDDFYKDMIVKFMQDHPDGNYTPCNWETDLQVIELEAGGARGEKGFSTVTSSANDDRNTGTSRPPGTKYEVLEYWGYVDGQDLQACGVEVEDVTLEYAANIWLIGDHPIKVKLYPGALTQYKVFYYEKDETSIFGEGLARVMRHSQIAIAAGARMVLNNGAISAGPIWEINWSLCTPDTDLNSMYSNKIIYREGKGVDAQYPAVRILNADNHIDELISIINLFKNFGDEETCLPTWMISGQVNNETAQATSGRMATILVSIKDVVKNFDTFTEHIIRDIYAWNMDFNPRTDIKGDFKCKALGVSSLVMKEVRMQALNQLSTTLTPEERDYIPEREFIQEKFKAHDINIPLLTDEEVQSKREARAQSTENQLAIKMAEAEIKYKNAQTMAQLTKAKDKNVEANIKAQTPIEQPENSDPRLQEAELMGKQTEIAGKEAEIRRKEEQHALDLQHKDEKHRTDIAIKTTQTAHDVGNKDKITEHGMKMKEKMTQAGVQAKKTQAKMKPAAPKPSKSAK